MKRYRIKVIQSSNYMSGLMESIGVISFVSGKNKGVFGISKNPLFSNWNGLDWDYLNISLTEDGVKVLRDSNIPI